MKTTINTCIMITNNNQEKDMKTKSAHYPDWVEDLPDEQAQPWVVHDQHPFVSVRQRDGGDPDTTHWVLIHKDEVEAFIEQVRKIAK